MAVAAVLTGMLSAASVPAAAVDERPGSDVYLDVIKYDRQRRVSVTVPTTFAFVVNGTMGVSTANISVSEGTLMLPNVTVRVNDHSSPTSSYDVEVSQEADMYVRNYSTQLTPPDSDGKQTRKGLGLQLDGYLENEGTDPSDRSYWQAADTEPGAADFKKYLLKVSVDEGTSWHTFNTTKAVNQLWLDTPLDLEAPDTTLGVDADSNLANVPATTGIDIDLKIGGQRNQYTQVEQSVKAGTVIWNVIAPDD